MERRRFRTDKKKLHAPLTERRTGRRKSVRASQSPEVRVTASECETERRARRSAEPGGPREEEKKGRLCKERGWVDGISEQGDGKST